ncbi:unnamed protein product [Jaminaea pallidilutea]
MAPKRSAPAPSTTSYSEPREHSAIFGSSRNNARRLHGNARIAEYRAMADLPRASEALAMLRRIGAIVKPIMLKHNWHVGKLTEFSGFSKNHGEVLGMNQNRGQVVFLRLRQKAAGSQQLIDAFLPEDDVVYTMLHELTHNVRGPHDDEFFRILKGLEEDWYELRRKGSLPGQGFWTPGNLLGAGHGRDLPLPMARRQAAEKAEERQKRQKMLQGGGRLGGQVQTTRSAADLAREAAERRIKMEGGCPSSQAEQEQAIRWHEEKDLLHGLKVIVIEDGDDDGDGDEDDTEEVQEITAAEAQGQAASSGPSKPGPSKSSENTPNAPSASGDVVELSSDTDDDDDEADEPILVSVKPSDKSTGDTGRGHSRTAATARSQDRSHPTRAIPKPTNPRSHVNPSASLATSTNGATAAASTRTTEEGWHCRSCTYWMRGDDAQMWICKVCGVVTRK